MKRLLLIIALLLAACAAPPTPTTDEESAVSEQVEVAEATAIPPTDEPEPIEDESVLPSAALKH